MKFYEKFCESAFSTHLARIFWGTGISVNFLGGLILLVSIKFTKRLPLVVMDPTCN